MPVRQIVVADLSGTAGSLMSGTGRLPAILPPRADVGGSQCWWGVSRFHTLAGTWPRAPKNKATDFSGPVGAYKRIIYDTLSCAESGHCAAIRRVEFNADQVGSKIVDYTC